MHIIAGGLREGETENNDIEVQFLLLNVTATLVCTILFFINIYTLLILMMNELSMKLLFILLFRCNYHRFVCFENYRREIAGRKSYVREFLEIGRQSRNTFHNY